MKTLLLISFLSLFGNNPSNDGIPYRTLSWADFRGAVPEKTTFAALTATQITYEFQNDQRGRYTFSVEATFDPTTSYVRIKSEAALRHEQTHFRIAFLMALECMQELKPLQQGGEGAEKKAEDIYARYVDSYSALNEQFDQETNHSQNVVAEKAWETKIADQLKTVLHGRNR